MKTYPKIVWELVAALERQLHLDAEWARVDPQGFAELRKDADFKAKELLKKVKATA